MTATLMIGTRGWDHDAWTGDFYPDELPADWRFCHYSNNLRSVLVPGEAWYAATPETVAQWAQDSDPDFRFVLELPTALLRPMPVLLMRPSLGDFLNTAAPILPQTAGFLLRPPAAGDDLAWLDRLLAALAAVKPVCLDAPAGAPGAPIQALAARHQAGLCWHTAAETEPCSAGRLRIGLSSNVEPARMRAEIDALHRGLPADAQAGLFFEAAPRAARLAQDARILAELMGV